MIFEYFFQRTYDGKFEDKLFPVRRLPHSSSFPVSGYLLQSQQTVTDDQDATPPGEF
jgi:hypothetical protein